MTLGKVEATPCPPLQTTPHVVSRLVKKVVEKREAESGW